MRPDRNDAQAYTTMLSGVKRYVDPRLTMTSGSTRARSRRALFEHPVPAARMSTRWRARCSCASTWRARARCPRSVRDRLARLAGQRLTRDGVIVITAQRYRTQERNRQDARDRLIALIRRAAAPPTPRRPTKPDRRRQSSAGSTPKRGAASSSSGAAARPIKTPAPETRSAKVEARLFTPERYFHGRAQNRPLSRGSRVVSAAWLSRSRSVASFRSNMAGWSRSRR